MRLKGAVSFWLLFGAIQAVTSPGLAYVRRLDKDGTIPFGEQMDYDDDGRGEFYENGSPVRGEYTPQVASEVEMYESDRWIPRGRKDQKQQSNMMNTFERFMRKAVKTVVPGDEPNGPSFGPGGVRSGFTWQAATVLSVMCVGAAVVGVTLGIAYWPKSISNSSGEVKNEGVVCAESVGDRSLAQSAQMYHYQQQKQQMLAMDEASGKVQNLDSNSDTEGECDEPDVNLYECPGLATASEQEVRNPLYQDDLGNNSAPSTGSGLKQ